MAEHGYLREGYGLHGERGPEAEDRSREYDREWRSRDQDRGWERNRQDRDGRREFMFGEARQRSPGRGRDEDRGWFGSGDDDRHDRSQGGARGFIERAGQAARSWFEDDDDTHRSQRRGGWSDPSREAARQRMSHYGPEHGYGGFQGDYSGGRGQGGFGGAGDWQQSRQSFSSHPDDHYRSWREKQMQALDDDYREYCREREQQFHQEFDSWRRNRQRQPGKQGQQQEQQQAQQGHRGQSGQYRDQEMGELTLSEPTAGSPGTSGFTPGTVAGSTDGETRVAASRVGGGSAATGDSSRMTESATGVSSGGATGDASRPTAANTSPNATGTGR